MGRRAPIEDRAMTAKAAMEKSDAELSREGAGSGAGDVKDAGGGSGSGDNEEEDEEEDEEDERWSSDESEFSDSMSVLSDDSVLPPMSDIDEGDCGDEEDDTPGAGTVSLFQACAKNNGPMVRFQLRRSPTVEEVTEMDNNGRTGLMVACYFGFVDVVVALAGCPYLDVNHKDKEGNTALLLAAQAGHITIINYLLNYYPGVDVEVRNVHGFTALMKAAMQGRSDCVTALMLSGADITATDPNRGLTPPEWALHTGRWETASAIRRLLSRPVPEQLRASFCPEWTSLAALVARAVAPRTCMQKLSECLRDTLTINFPRDPDAGGVLDHMVRVSTSLASPFVSTACSTLCPDSPPAVGKRGVSVPELAKMLDMASDSCNGGAAARKIDHRAPPRRTDVLVIAGSDSPRRRRPDRRVSMCSTVSGGVGVALPASGASGARGGEGGGGGATESYRVRYGARTRSLPVNLWRRNSVCPGGEPPRVKLIKASPPGRRRASADRGGDGTKRHRRRKSMDKHLLEIPKWRYKEIKEEKKRAQEEEENKKQQQQKGAAKKT
ncbi:ankyrin repeat domain-containing protein 33B [Lampetra fluviatilis]